MSKSAKFVKVVTPIALAIALAACGGGSDKFGSAGTGSGGSGSGTGGSGSGTGGSGDTDNGGTGTVELTVLHLDPVKIGLTSLSAGGSTGITVELKDQNNNFSNKENTLTFTSACISNGTSEIVSPVTSSLGVFTTTYTAKGCEGDDVITAAVGALSTTGTINVLPANLGAVEFISAEPKNILLAGMSAAGFSHTSKVTFQIKNDVGGPIANADVDFELVKNGAGDGGGVKLSSLVGKTNNDGFVSTILEAGSVHTTVKVRATVVRGSTSIQSESSQLSISTGIADQNSLSLSFSTLNPAAWNNDGVEVDVNIIASDRYNNPVPDGTAVSFYTELGQIQPSCETANGRCTVKWISAAPRDLGINDIRYPHEGITTVTAKVIGEESFLDNNANGVFDDGDVFDTDSDRGEAFADYNKEYGIDRDGSGSVDTYVDLQGNIRPQNGYDQGLDRFILDFDGDGSYDPKDEKYTGLGCEHPTLCAADNGLKDIFASGEIVLSEDNQDFKIIDLSNSSIVVDTSENVFGQLEVGKNYLLEVFGVTNKQVPPEGTSISVSGDGVKVLGGKLDVGSTNAHGSDVSNPYGPARITFGLTEPKSITGSVDITIDTKKVKVTRSIRFIIPEE